jgi:hypothetical protein
MNFGQSRGKIQLGYCEIQIRPQGVKVGQHQLVVDNPDLTGLKAGFDHI